MVEDAPAADEDEATQEEAWGCEDDVNESPDDDAGMALLEDAPPAEEDALMLLPPSAGTGERATHTCTPPACAWH